MGSSLRSRPRRVGVMVAMDEEFVRISRSLQNAAVFRIGPREFMCAQLSGVDVVCVRSRIGKVAAASTVTTLINRFEVDAVVFTGVAGGVASQIRVGDLVVADTLMQHDIDLKGVLECKRFDIPLLGTARMQCSPELLDVAVASARTVVESEEYRSSTKTFCAHAPSARIGTIASGDTFVCSSHEREDLVRGIPDLLCVEMEGGAVSQVCLEYGVPCVVCRIVSDSADAEARFDFQGFLESAAAVGSQLFVSNFVYQLSQLPVP